MSHRHPHPHDGQPEPPAMDGIDTSMPLHARECIEHCMFNSSGPGKQLKDAQDRLKASQGELASQIDRWRGRDALAKWVVSGFMLALLSMVSWAIWSYKTATRQIVVEEMDRRLGIMVEQAAKKAEARVMWAFPAAEAQPLLDHRYQPGVPSRETPGDTPKRRTP